MATPTKGPHMYTPPTMLLRTGHYRPGALATGSRSSLDLGVAVGRCCMAGAW